MATANRKSRKVAAGFAVLFVGLVAGIISLTVRKVITIQMAGLMFVALIGLYVGFAVLIAVYRFVEKLQ